MQLVARSVLFYQSRSVISEFRAKVLISLFLILRSYGCHTDNFRSYPPDAINVLSLFHLEASNMLFYLKIDLSSPLSLHTRANPSEALVTTASPVC